MKTISGCDHFLGLHKSHADVFQWCNLDNGNVSKKYSAKWTSRWAQLSQDRKSILFANRPKKAIFIGSLDGDGEPKMFLEKDFGPHFAAFSPDQQQVIGMDKTSRTVIWDTKSREVITNRMPTRAIQRKYLIPIAGTKLFMSTYGANALVVWDPLTGTDQAQVRVPIVDGFVLSDDGKYVLTADRSADLKLWRLPDLPPR